MDWYASFNLEINRAEIARASGNEGRARVCARRAAGIVIGEWLRRNGEPLFGPSSYDRIRQFMLQSDISKEAIDITSHFLIKVDPEFHLPADVDLIQDARCLENLLLENFVNKTTNGDE